MIGNLGMGLRGYFVERGILDQAALDTLGDDCRSDAELGERLLQSGLVSEDQLVAAYAALFALKIADADSWQVDAGLLESFEPGFLNKHAMCPAISAGQPCMIVSNPYRLGLLEQIENRTGLQFKVFLSPAESIRRKLSSITPKDRGSGRPGRIELQATSRGEENNPIVRLVHDLLGEGIARRASDVHIERHGRKWLVRYRIDGVLGGSFRSIEEEDGTRVINRLKVLSSLDITEMRVPQDGSFVLEVEGHPVDFRISVLPGIEGEDVVIRILDKAQIRRSFKKLDLDCLGFDVEAKRLIRRAIREPYGMVLVTGPTGSGKTTTLYAILSEILTDEQKIVTIEDPVEYHIPGILHTQVNERAGYTFASGLRSILRHDPDIIMVGEIRDEETAKVAVQAALTGHLVFSTLHANTAADVIGRFRQFEGIDRNFMASFNLIISQRLVRTNCTQCRQELEVSSEQIEESLGDGAWAGLRLYAGKGCEACTWTGYHGRTIVSEIMPMSARIKDLAAQQSPSEQIRQAAREEGMRSLRESAVQTVVQGLTTLSEINRVTFAEPVRA